MKKSLVALAVLAASGAAMAQSSVTLYGVADIGLARQDNGSTSVTRLDSGNLNGSRWGLKGTEDLGGGLKAIFTVEAGFSLDTGATAATTTRPNDFFNRQSFVGLAGGFGTVKLGRQTNPVYSNSSTFDPFGNALSGDTSKLLNYQSSRTDNAITYAYAANGFRGEFQYALGEVAGNSSASHTVAGFVGYKAGPIDVVVTTQDTRNATDTDSTKVTLLGGNYDFGVAKAFLTFDSEKGTGTTDLRNTVVGARVPLGAGTVIVSYISHQNKAVSSSDSHLFGLGYTYDLSKRTALYTSYGRLTNDSGAKLPIVSVTSAGALAAPALGGTGTLFNVGVRHNF
jgi:predicted porin